MPRKKRETKLERLEYENSRTLRWSKCQLLASTLYRSEIPTSDIEIYIEAIYEDTIKK
jgi:hypothetical protein